MVVLTYTDSDPIDQAKNKLCVGSHGEFTFLQTRFCMSRLSERTKVFVRLCILQVRETKNGALLVFVHLIFLARQRQPVIKKAPWSNHQQVKLTCAYLFWLPMSIQDKTKGKGKCERTKKKVRKRKKGRKKERGKEINSIEFELANQTRVIFFYRLHVFQSQIGS